MNGSEQTGFDFLKRDEVRRLNDDFRTTGVGGRFMITPGIAALPHETLAAVMAAVQSFDAFDTGNDPYGEHDFASVDVDGRQVFWKIDYYDRALSAASPNPADPCCTTRVLTIMLASEY